MLASCYWYHGSAFGPEEEDGRCAEQQGGAGSAVLILLRGRENRRPRTASLPADPCLKKLKNPWRRRGVMSDGRQASDWKRLVSTSPVSFLKPSAQAKTPDDLGTRSFRSAEMEANTIQPRQRGQEDIEMVVCVSPPPLSSSSRAISIRLFVWAYFCLAWSPSECNWCSQGRSRNSNLYRLTVNYMRFLPK